MAKLRTNLSPDELDRVANALKSIAAARRVNMEPIAKAQPAQEQEVKSIKDRIQDAGSAHTKAQNPASIGGTAAPGNSAGPGRGHTDLGTAKTVNANAKTNISAGKTNVTGGAKTKVSESAKTQIKGGSGGGKDFVYLSKKDFPEAPKGTVDSTPNSWKVPAGIGRALVAKMDNSNGQPAAPENTNAKAFAKQNKPRAVVALHLKHGEITSKKSLDGGGASESFKVQIEGNGMAIMKPNVNVLFDEQIDERDEKPAGEEGWSFNEKTNKWNKAIKVEYDLYNPKAMGSFGSGNMPYKKNVEREASAYNLACLMGLDAHVPVTVTRTHEGKDHSLQSWKDGYMSIDALAKAKGVESGTDWEVISKVVPRDKHEKVAQQLMDLAVFDIVCNNQDRHGNNFIVNENGDVQLIDHGFSFGNSVSGSRNHFLQNVFHKNKPIVMSETMMTRLNNQSFSDHQRAMPGMYDWEAGQAFMRSRYVCFLQKEHGTIDRQKFLNTVATNDATMKMPGDPSDWSFAGSKISDHMEEFNARSEEGLLPDQMFNSWAKAYLEEASADPSHPDHHDAKKLKDIGIFMEQGFCSFLNGKGSEFYRKFGKHKEFEKSIKANIDIPKDVSAAMREKRQRKYEERVAADSARGGEDSTAMDRGAKRTVAADGGKTRK